MPYDPTRTTLLRRKFGRAIKGRFDRIYKAVKILIIDDDVFGLIQSMPMTLQEKQAWRFRNNPEKVKSFRKWLQTQIDAEMLTVDAKGKPWTAEYIDSAYRKGLIRGYMEVHKSELAEKPDFYLGSREQFIKSAFMQPETMSKVELLYTRAFEELRGVSATMSQQLSRTLAEGLTQGQGPLKISREMRKQITSLSKTRGDMIARTEIIRAHAEGALDSYEKLGIEEIGLQVEWSAAYDACPECESMANDSPYGMDEARGMIPLHPNCLPGNSLVSPCSPITGFSKRWYDGDMIILKTSFNDELICTPNHEILTINGFVPANKLDVGNNIICNSLIQRKSLINCDDINMPFRIKDIAESFIKKSSSFTVPMPVSSIDFNGDGIGSKVAIIGTNSLLTNGFHSFACQYLFQLYFVFRNIGRSFLNCFGMFTFRFKRNMTSPNGFICGSYLSNPLFFRHLTPFQRFRFALCSYMYSRLNKSSSNNISTGLKCFRNFIFRHPILIKVFNFIDRKRKNILVNRLLKQIGSRFDNSSIIQIESFYYSGYVYNIETTESYYISNNIASHNCRCAWIPYVSEKLTK